ncbi:MAG: hypothetical protein ACR2HH_13360 [Chthoniobacterales bacterium]
MKQKATGANPQVTDRQITEGLRQIFGHNRGRILGTAGRSWEQIFAGREPSDACVRVRISGRASTAVDRLGSAQRQYASLTA